MSCYGYCPTDLLCVVIIIIVDAVITDLVALLLLSGYYGYE